MQEKESPSQNSVEQKLSDAVSLVKGGSDPMKGIMMLREILLEDSNNLEAHFILGEFSMQSGQWEKAKQRFQKVLELDSNYHDAYFNLASTEVRLGDTTRAVSIYEKFINLTKDPKRKDQAISNINELKK